VLRRADYLLLAAAAISFVLAVILWFTGHRDEGLFVSIWVPSILGLGIYINLARGTRGGR
jgi:hypothetical protein